MLGGTRVVCAILRGTVVACISHAGMVQGGMCKFILGEEGAFHLPPSLLPLLPPIALSGWTCCLRDCGMMVQ